MIRLSHIDFSYGNTPVLRDFSLTLPESGVLCLFGPSGCGKTTVARLLLGLEQPQRGTVDGVPPKKAAVFQEDRLLPWKTVWENVTLPHTANGADRAAAILRRVGLTEAQFSRYPHELSGGMRRRVAIARALASGGDFLLLDEPFSGIDAENGQAIAALIRDYAVTHPVLLITHLPHEAAWLDAQTHLMPTPPT